MMPAKRPYLPPFAVILGMLGINKEDLPVAGDQMVTVPFGILCQLLRGTLLSVPFHEERYLHMNPDVAGAVFRGDIRSGQDHFISNGYFEGRQGGSEGFAEAWYLEANTDVAVAVHAGTFASAHEHYLEAGMYELRSPNPRAEEELATWRSYWVGAPNPLATADERPVAVTQDG
jgi:hypothetical protein